MKRLLIFFGVFLITTCVTAQTRELKRVSPESVGISSKAVENVMLSLLADSATDIHSVMVLRHGKVIGEMYPKPYKDEYQHTMYSASKTFVSAAVGIAIGENRLRLNDRVATFFPEYLPDSIPENLAMMTVRDLLVMSSGIEPDWEMRNITREWIPTFFRKEIKTPGKQFKYDSIDTYLLSAIVTKVTGKTLLEYLQERIFNHLGIKEVEWQISKEGFNTGGWGLYIQPESLAKFGQLLLNRGKWNGCQLIPTGWVDEMMKKQMESGGPGYGYQMWVGEYPGSARADGAFGQFVLVIPDKDMVVVITECSVLGGEWHRRAIWPMVKAAQEDALPASKGYQKMLKKLDAITLPTAVGKRKGGKLPEKTFTLEENTYDWKGLDFKQEGKDLIMTIHHEDGNTTHVALGIKEWLTTETASYPAYSIIAKERFNGIDGPFHIAGSYGWAKDGKLNIILQYVDWITRLDMTVEFKDDELVMTIVENYQNWKRTLKGK